jgi:glycine C-acetyltransferase
VPEAKARVRIIMTSEHTREQLDRALEILVVTAKRKNIL